jgi:hypothetical protein
VAAVTARADLSFLALATVALLAWTIPAGAAPPQPAASDAKSAEPQAIKRPAKRTGPGAAKAPDKPEPLFMSEEYVAREKLKEDALKRAMKICSGC